MSDQEVTILPAIKKGRPKGRKTSKAALGRRRQAKVLDLAARGMNQIDIAKATGLSKQGVSKLLAEFKDVFAELQNVDNYRSVRGELLDAAELMALKSAVDREKHDKAGLQHVAYTLRQLHDMRRLHNNLSTSNTLSQSISIAVNPDGYGD